MIELEFNLTPADYDRALIRPSRPLQTLQLFVAIASAAFCLYIIGSSLVALSGQILKTALDPERTNVAVRSGLKWIIPTLIAALAFTGWFVVFLVRYVRFAWRAWRAPKDLREFRDGLNIGAAKYVLSPGGLLVKMKYVRKLLPWRAFAAVIDTPDAICLRYAMSDRSAFVGGIFIPGRIVAGDRARQELVDFADRHISETNN